MGPKSLLKDENEIRFGIFFHLTIFSKKRIFLEKTGEKIG